MCQNMCSKQKEHENKDITLEEVITQTTTETRTTLFLRGILLRDPVTMTAGLGTLSLSAKGMGKNGLARLGWENKNENEARVP